MHHRILLTRIICFLLSVSLSTVAFEHVMPDQLRVTLDAHAKELQDFLSVCNDHPHARRGRNVTRKSWLPGYYIKYGIERLDGAQRIKAAKQKHKLDLIEAPIKYPYHVPSRPRRLSSKNYLVIAKEESDSGQELSKQLARQLYLCARKAKIYDLHTSNYVVTAQGKVVIIDTGQPEQSAHKQPDATMQEQIEDLMFERRMFLKKQTPGQGPLTDFCRKQYQAPVCLAFACSAGIVLSAYKLFAGLGATYTA